VTCRRERAPEQRPALDAQRAWDPLRGPRGVTTALLGPRATDLLRHANPAGTRSKYTRPKRTNVVIPEPPGSSGSPTVGGGPVGTSFRSGGFPGPPAKPVPAVTRSSAHTAASVLIRVRALIGNSLGSAHDARGHPARLGCEFGRKRKCLPRLRGPRGGQALDPQVRGGGSPWRHPNPSRIVPGQPCHARPGRVRMSTN